MDFTKEFNFRLACAGDKEKILAMDVEVYGGLDYLNHESDELFNQPDVLPFVCERDGKIIGFRYYALVDGGTSVVGHARRIEKQHQHKGVDKIMDEYCAKEVAKIWPDVVYLTGTQIYDGNCGISPADTLSSNAIIICYVQMFYTKFVAEDLAMKISNRDHGLKQLSKDEAVLILTSERYDNIFGGDTVVISWKPYKRISANVDTIYRRLNPVLFADYKNNTGDCSSVSFSSFTLLSKHDQALCEITIYAKSKETATKHALAQINYAAKTTSRKQLCFWFALFCPLSRKELLESLSRYGISENSWHGLGDPRMFGAKGIFGKPLKKKKPQEISTVNGKHHKTDTSKL